MHPDDPLVRARLAEILLILGYRADAERTAREAVELAPEMGEAQTILGLAALVRAAGRGAEDSGTGDPA